jgi:ribosomal subunit interface protein
MKIQPAITYRNLDRSDAIDRLITDKIAKLERLCDYISRCEIVLEKSQDRPKAGSPYRVRIDLTIPPNHEIVGESHPEEQKQYVGLDTVVREAFSKTERQVKELTRRQREFEQSKTHSVIDATAIVTKLFPEQDYGFIRSLDADEEVYFHRNSVTHGDFDRLTVGTAVRYTVVEGEQGPQASSVHIVDKPGERAGKAEETLIEPPLGWK